MIARRELLARSMLAASGMALDCAECKNLRVAAYTAGLHFGSDSDVALSAAPDYGSLILRNCDLFAPNLNWKLLAPTSQDTLHGVDPNIGLMTKNGLRLTGYHLLWHLGTPAWFEALDPVQAERAVSDHIGALGTAFGAHTFSWNVVNEAISPAQGRADGLRPNAFLEKFGTAYFDIAFSMARQAAPRALRVYNDYDLELDTAEHARRRATLLGLLDMLHARSVPIQAVGLQSHLRAATFANSFNAAQYRKFLADLASRGLRILITELDVLDLSTAPIPVRDQMVADVYRRFLETALEEKALVAVTTWGLSDRYSWLNDPNRRSFRRPDGTPARPLPFDEALKPKLALTAMLQAFEGAPGRTLFRPA